MTKHLRVQMRWLVMAAAGLGLLAGCGGGGDKGVAEAKKAIRAASAAQGESAAQKPDSDDYLERYQTPEQRLEARQNRLRGAVATAWATSQATTATAAVAPAPAAP